MDICLGTGHGAFVAFLLVLEFPAAHPELDCAPFDIGQSLAIELREIYMVSIPSSRVLETALVEYPVAGVAEASLSLFIFPDWMDQYTVILTNVSLTVVHGATKGRRSSAYTFVCKPFVHLSKNVT